MREGGGWRVGDGGCRRVPESAEWVDDPGCLLLTPLLLLQDTLLTPEQLQRHLAVVRLDRVPDRIQHHVIHQPKHHTTQDNQQHNIQLHLLLIPLQISLLVCEPDCELEGRWIQSG